MTTRRQFLQSLGAVAAAGHVAPAASLPLALVERPESKVGTRFVGPAGTMTLVGVERIPGSARCEQLRLQFRVEAGAPPVDCVSEFTAAGESLSLFLQPGEQGPVAWFNRLIA